MAPRFSTALSGSREFKPPALPEVSDLLVSMVTAVQQSAKLKELDAQGFRVKTGAVAQGVTPHMHWHILGPGIPPLDWESLTLGMKERGKVNRLERNREHAQTE